MNPSIGRVFIFGWLVLTLSACTELDDTNTSSCVPECGPNLRCIEGQCQPILCAEASECVLGQICYEGRCAPSCDGETRCPSGVCEDGLCTGTMECSNGDVRACMTACGDGVERCMNSAWSLCSAGVPTAQDICEDGVDNDCDGDADEGCPACAGEARRPCENACGSGEQVCEDGLWSVCSTPPPDGAGECPCAEEAAEACDTPCGRGIRRCESGVFGPCLFEGNLCECADGAREPCETPCGTGQRVCRAGAWSACDGPEPTSELCGNGLDEDCDGTTDEDCAECPVSFIDQPSIVTQLDSQYQSVPIVALNSSIWLAYFRDRAGRRVSAYARYRVLGDDFRLTSALESDLPTLLSLYQRNDSVLGVGFDVNRDLGIEVVQSSEIRRQETVQTARTAQQYFVLANSPTLQVLYGTPGEDLYLQSVPRDMPRPAPLRLTAASAHRISPALDSQGLSVFYQSEEGNFPEGRVLSMVRVELSPNRVLSDTRLLDPRDDSPLFGFDPVVHFASDRYLMVYSRRIDTQLSFFSVMVDLNGRVLTAPREVYRAPPRRLLTRPQMAASRTHRLLVWSEYENVDTEAEIKYLALDPSGNPSSPVVSVYAGQVSFPKIAWPPAGRPVLIWTQEEAAELGDLISLKIATVPAMPSCP